VCRLSFTAAAATHSKEGMSVLSTVQKLDANTILSFFHAKGIEINDV
jgi:hypothetical protein